MKHVTLLSALMATIPLGLQAQDDLYFNPSKDKDEVKTTMRDANNTSYYSGIGMTDDEYNRFGSFESYYQKIGKDSLGNDIISHYNNADGALSTDTVYLGNQRYYFDDDDDFAYSRRMSRFDNFYGWYDPYYSCYWYDPWYADRWAWGWRSPYYYASYWSWPYYSSWTWHYGWPDTYWGWHPGYWGWSYPSTVWVGHTGTRNHSYARDDRHTYQHQSARPSYGNQSRSGTYTRPSNMNRNDNTRQNNRNFGGTRTYNPNQNSSGTRSYSPQPSAPRGSSFGGSRSSFGGGGSFGGGSRMGGGGGGSHGGFGGRR